MIGYLDVVGVLRQTRGVSGGVDFLAETFPTKPRLDKSSFHRALIDVLCQIGEDLMTESAKTHRIILGDAGDGAEVRRLMVGFISGGGGGLAALV